MVEVVSCQTWTVLGAHPRLGHVVVCLHELSRITDMATDLSLRHFRGNELIESFLRHLSLDLLELLESLLSLNNKTHL